MNETPELGLRALVGLIAISVPVLLGLETLLRVYVFAPIYGPLITDIAALYWPGFDLGTLGPRATGWVWNLYIITSVAGLTGLLVLRWTVARALAKADRPAVASVRDQLLLMTSIPQVPGVLATLCFTIGAELGPVLGCIGLSTVFVLTQGFVGERLLAGFVRTTEDAQTDAAVR